MAVDLGLPSSVSNSHFGTIIEHAFYGATASVADEVTSNAIQPRVAAALDGNATASENASGTPWQTAVGLAGDGRDGALALQAAGLQDTQEPSDLSSFAAAWQDLDSRSTAAGVPGSVSQTLAGLQAASSNLSVYQSELFGGQVAEVASGSEASEISTGTAESSLLVGGGMANFVPSKGRLGNAAAGESDDLPADFVGWVCQADGSFHQNTALVAEGEYDGESGDESGEGGAAGSDGDSPFTPIQVAWPDLEFSNFNGSPDDYVPASQTTGSSVDTAGAFSASTTADADLSLPGVNWVHSTDRNWTDATHWSFTETLVMGFNESTEISDGGDADGSASTSADSGETSNEDVTEVGGIGTDGSSQESGVTEGSWTGKQTSYRQGFVILSFHAERGITTPPAAGVAWSIHVSFRDELGFTFEAGGGETVSPDPTTLDNALSGAGSGDGGPMAGEGDGSFEDVMPIDGTGDGFSGEDDTLEPLPADFEGTSSWSLNVGLSLWTGGSFAISSTPSLASGGTTGSSVDRSFSSSGSLSGGTGLTTGGGWASSSRSGHALGNPIDYIAGNTIPWNNPQNGVLPGSAEGDHGRITGGGAADSPIEPLDGDGHEFGSSGGFDAMVRNSRSSGWDAIGNLRNGVFQSIAGSMTTDLKNEIGDNFQDNVIYAVQKSEGDFVGGDGWNASLQFGKNISPSIAASVSGSITAELGLGSDGTPTSTPSVTSVLSGSTSDEDREILNLRISAVSPTEHGSWTGRLSISSSDTAKDDAELKMGEPEDGSSPAETSGNPDDDEGNYLKEDWFGSGTSTVDIHTVLDENWVHESISSSSSDVTQYVDLHKLDLKTVNTYESDASAQATVGSPDSIAFAGGGSTTETETTTYSSSNRSFIDTTSVNYDYGSWSRYANDIDRHAAFTSSKTSGASFTDETVTINEPTVTGDSEVQVWGTLTSKGNLSSDLQDLYDPNAVFTLVEDINNYAGLQLWNQELEAGLNGIEYHVYEGSFLPIDDYPDNPYNTSGTWWAGAGGTFMGLGQGAANLVNGVQDVAIGTLNLPATLHNASGAAIGYVLGTGNSGWGFTIPYIPSPDWSRDLITHEGGTPGGWDDTHGWSKFLTGEGAVTLATAGVGSLASKFDDLGNCANRFTKFLHGGCFVPGTLVTLSDMPRSDDLQSQLWSEGDLDDSLLASGFDWLDSEAPATASVLTATRTTLQIPIEDVPLGARVPTQNPKPWEFDDSLPEPDEASWVVVSFTVERKDGGLVDAELLRPQSWIDTNGLAVGKLLPIDIEELRIEGAATVTAIESAPAIAGGEGSAVTGRFITRRVDKTCRIEVLGSDGTADIIEGTIVHPIWSIDASDWVPLGELQEGERLLTASSPATVFSRVILNRPTPVYNIEVHGEHVFEVGELQAIVHNSYYDDLAPERIANVDELVDMMNKRSGTKAEFATGDAKRYLEAVGAEGSHLLDEAGNSHILLRKDVATRHTAMHEWLHRHLQRKNGGPIPGEENLIESFLERHKDLFKLND